MTKKEFNTNYEIAFSDFMFEIASKIGGGLPTDYFNDEDLTKIEENFRKIYNNNKKINGIVNGKGYCDVLGYFQ